MAWGSRCRAQGRGSCCPRPLDPPPRRQGAIWEETVAGVSSFFLLETESWGLTSPPH